MKSFPQIAVLTSGGLDSAILIHLLSKRGSVSPVYIKSGHVWEKIELFWLRKFLSKIRRPGLKPLSILNSPTSDLYGTHWSITGKKVPGQKSRDEKVFLPGKNLLLIAKTSVYCALHKIPRLALGPLKTNPFADAKISFFKVLEKSCSQALSYRLKIMTPFLNKTKKQVMQLGKNLPLELTFSCIRPVKNLHCGTCNKCAERKKAFRLIHLPDKTKYVH